MAWTAYHYGLALVMTITGSINTLSTKWADKLYSVGADGELRPFVHPFFQSCSMFLGELLCLLAFKAIYSYYLYKQDTLADVRELVRGNRNFNPLVFLPPALLDMTSTSIMYIGLTLTYASSFQMLRGSVIVFVALLSVAFRRRVITRREYIGMFVILVGLIVVGLSDFATTKDTKTDTNAVITGDLLILIAQIITAVQMIYEEKYVTELDIPALQAVGWEGFFGFVVLGLLQFPFYYIHVGQPFSNNSRGTLEDVPDAFVQLSNNPMLRLSILGTVLSIAFFNFAGISVTKEMSATTRMVLDTVRTLFIWLVSLYLKWQEFHVLQILGFSLLIFGLCTYNDLIPSSTFIRQSVWRRRVPEDNEGDDNDFLSQPADQP